jgi:hypothetical protein
MNKNKPLWQSFEIRGYWWLADSPERKAFGIMTYSATPRTQIELKVFGSLTANLKSPEGQQPQIIHGVYETGYSCTLLDCYRTNITSGLSSVLQVPETTYVVSHLLTGIHSLNFETQNFTSISLNIKHLEEWVGIAPFDYSSNSNSLFSVEYTHPPELCMNLQSIDAQIKTQGSLNHTFGSIRNCRANYTCYLSLTPNSPQSLKWFLDKIFQLQQLFTLMIGEIAEINVLSATTDEELESIQIYSFVGTHTPDQNELHPVQMLAPAVSLGGCENALKVIDVWFEKTEKLHSAFDLVFSIVFGARMYVENQILNLTQAFEALHRATHDGSFMSEKEFKKLIEPVLRAIPEDMDSSHRDSLKARIKWGWEYTQRNRLKELIGEAPPNVLKVFAEGNSNYKRYVDKITETRNYLVHRDESGESTAMTNEEMAEAIYRMKIVIFSLLLIQLGISSERVDNLILAYDRNNGKLFH